MTPPDFSTSALLLLGHGSTLNADSSAPTYQHAETIRARGLFAEVQVGFWKEEPNFRQALRQTPCRRVYVVPNFISSGYFTEQIIPRELGLTGAITELEGREVIYCPPVGLHPSMIEVLLQRAREVVASSGESIEEPARSACLFICGHGTSLNDNSTKIIHEQAEAIRARGLFADCQGVLMEQSPFVKDWRMLTACPDVIVVPFFISDGLHSFEDIPVLLGLTHNVKGRGFTNPHREDSRRLWYATAIGTEARMAEVILAQVEQMAPAQPAPKISWEGTQALPFRIGQVAVHAGYVLTHLLDHPSDTNLRGLETEGDLRELIRLNDAGAFRPLRAAPDLRRGWIYRAQDADSICRALDYFYPAELANAQLHAKNALPAIPWHETAERQTGRFRVVREIDEAALQEIVREVCDRQCLKRRLWPPAGQTVEPGHDEIPLLCPEACNYFVGKVREKLKGPAED